MRDSEENGISREIRLPTVVVRGCVGFHAANNSETVQGRSANPAAIAGVRLIVEWTRTKL